MTHKKNEYRELSKLFIRKAREDLNVTLKFDKNSVKWVDGYINHVRKILDEKKFKGLSNILGAFIGGCIIVEYGGMWVYNSSKKQWGIELYSGKTVFPINQALKQLKNGKTDSVLSFYNNINSLLKPKTKK